MITVAALAIGLVIGMSLGALGGGGSILTVPALVYVLGEPTRRATTESLIVVGATALAATFAHARAGHVRWRAGAVFGLAGLAASYAGSAANSRVDPQVLLLAFAALMLAAAAAMLTSNPTATRTRGREMPAIEALAKTRRTPGSAAGKILVAGSAVGFLTGFLGVGGGFVIVPVLVMALGYEMADAVGTSLLVIAVNSAAALLARSGHTQLHWALLGPFIAAALAGSFAGHLAADRLPEELLKKAFAGLLILTALYVAIRAGAALAR